MAKKDIVSIGAGRQVVFDYPGQDPDQSKIQRADYGQRGIIINVYLDVENTPKYTVRMDNTGALVEVYGFQISILPFV